MRRASIATVAVLALVLAGCTSKSASPPGPTGSTSQTESSTPTGSATATSTESAAPLLPTPFNDHGQKSVSGAFVVTVEMDDFYFEPSVLKGSPGQKINISLKNNGAVEHNFSITEQNLSQDVDKGESKTVNVAFPASGYIQFQCKYHVGQGMKGALAV